MTFWTICIESISEVSDDGMTNKETLRRRAVQPDSSDPGGVRGGELARF
jgi:hypothetical protein